jgi:hypothetical protein
MSEFETVIYNGTYYGPESKKCSYQTISELCDKCKKTNIKACISYIIF